MGFAMRRLVRLLVDRSGAAAAEYALVLALTGAALTFGAVALGTSITGAVGDGAQCESSAAC